MEKFKLSNGSYFVSNVKITLNTSGKDMRQLLIILQ